MDGNNFENNGQNTQNNGGANGQYGNSPNNNEANGQYRNYQSNLSRNNPYGNYQDNTANYPYNPPVVNRMADNRANGLQVAGLICGILAICACWCYGFISVILGIAGIICSVVGNGRGKNGVGIAGLVCSIIGLLFGVIAAIYFVWALTYLNEIGFFNQYFNSYYR